MRIFCLILTLIVFSGCAWLDSPSVEPTRQIQPAGAKAQYKAAEDAFQKKLNATVGLPLAELRAQWGRVQQGVSRNNITVYHWQQTIAVTPPPRAAAEVGLESGKAGNPAGQALALSCLAVFIVQHGVVVEASSEGRCLDPSRMPGWRPEIRTAGAAGTDQRPVS